MGKKLRAKTKKDKPKPCNKDGTIIKNKIIIIVLYIIILDQILHNIKQAIIIIDIYQT